MDLIFNNDWTIVSPNQITLSCSGWKVQSQQNNTFEVFLFNVKDSGLNPFYPKQLREWSIEKRYSECLSLHETLLSFFPSMADILVDCFPPKSIIKGENFLFQRQLQLNHYFNMLSSEILNCDLMLDFLSRRVFFLNEECYQKIFLYLDYKSLKSCYEVCKEWKELFTPTFLRLWSSKIRNRNPTQLLDMNFGNEIVIDYHLTCYFFENHLENSLLGKCYFSNGDTFKGEFDRSRNLLRGLMKYKSKRVIYEGEFKASQKNGKGKLISKKGDEYIGEFKNGSIIGTGKVSFKNGDIIEFDDFQGRNVELVKYSFQNGSRYEGEIQFSHNAGLKEEEQQEEEEPILNIENFSLTGFGKLIFSNGDGYEGQVKDAKMHGHGRMTKNGCQIEGQFEMNQLEGNSLFSGLQERSIVCSCKNHLIFLGLGKQIYSNGTIYEGMFKNWKKEGRGKIIYPNGDELSGTFLNDSILDEGQVLMSNGVLYS